MEENNKQNSVEIARKEELLQDYENTTYMLPTYEQLVRAINLRLVPSMISYRRLGADLGISYVNICRICMGRNKCASYDTLKKIYDYVAEHCKDDYYKYVDTVTERYFGSNSDCDKELSICAMITELRLKGYYIINVKNNQYVVVDKNFKVVSRECMTIKEIYNKYV